MSADAAPVPAGQEGSLSLAEKVKALPPTPGVYLMKDSAGRVIYVGKAKNLRNRVSTYFTKPASTDPRTADLIPAIADIDFLPTPTEVDALLLEARLIKDIQPRFNVDLKDDKSFPYLQIRLREDYPRVEFTRAPRRGAKLYGPFTSARGLRGAIQALQRIFQFRTCPLDLEVDDPKWRWYRPCLLHSIGQCTAPCNFSVTKEQYREQIRRLMLVLDGKKDKLLEELRASMRQASTELRFEKAAKLRDDIQALERLSLRGQADRDVQPEVFVLDPKRGVRGLQKVLGLAKPPRVIEGFDIAHLHGNAMVAAMVQFVDGVPFKPGYRRFKIETVAGVDDFAAMREVVTRRYRRLQEEEGDWPNLILIDGGLGQLHAAEAALAQLHVSAPQLIALAKREEELFRCGQAEPLRLSRNAAALRLLQYIRDEAHRFAQHYHHLLRHQELAREARAVDTRRGSQPDPADS